jgi:hypothetical protein
MPKPRRAIETRSIRTPSPAGSHHRRSRSSLGHANSYNGSEAGAPSPVSHLGGAESSQTRRCRKPDSNRWSLAERPALGRVSKKSVEQQLDAKDEALAHRETEEPSHALLYESAEPNIPTAPYCRIARSPAGKESAKCPPDGTRVFARDRWFESSSLQQRVTCDFSAHSWIMIGADGGSTPAPMCGVIGDGNLDQAWLTAWRAGSSDTKPRDPPCG